MILLALEVLLEEISVISSEQWSAMDIVLQELKQVKLPFGGKLVIASGDHLQLPEHFVRMTDELGQKVLRYMWNRPFDPQAIMESLRNVLLKIRGKS